MKRLALVLSLLAAGCATVPRADMPDANWLEGVWLLIDDETAFPGDCPSGLPIRYHADGTYSLFEEAGVWRLSGDRLTETATSASESAEPGSVSIGLPFRSRIIRIGPGEMRKTFADGSTSTLRRCPTP